MRVLMKVQLPPEGLSSDGLPQTLGQIMERLQPEAAYFYPEHGQRTALFVFDLESPADMPAIAEPLFRAGAAAVDWSPAMNIDDLREGLSRVTEGAAAPA